MKHSYRMKLSSNGQVSIPAAVRERWRADDTLLADEMIVIDFDDYVIVGPALVDPVATLEGKYAGLGPSTDEMRREERAEEAERERQRERGW